MQTLLKPRIKRVFAPLPLGDRKIAIGGIDAGFAADIDADESGHVWHLLTLLDGTRNMDDLTRDMQRDGCSVPREDIEAAVATLSEAGYLEDATVCPPPGTFTRREIARYRRNADFLSFFSPSTRSAYDAQARLLQARVVVLGLGGLGASIAASLASAGVGTLRVVDFDTVELSNLNRQVLYTEADLGRPKSEAAARALHQTNPNVAIDPVERRIESVADAHEVVSGYDFVVCAADRPRYLIHEWVSFAAAAEGIPWAWGSNVGLTLQMGLIDPGRTGCFECERLRGGAEHSWYELVRHWQINVLGDRDVNPCIAPVSMMLAGKIALEVVFFLTQSTKPASYGVTVSYDLRTLQSRLDPVPVHPKCTACRSAARLEAA